MRIVEVLVEGYSDQLESDLSDLLAAASARNMVDVPTEALVAQLVGMGHNVNSNSIMTILNGNPFVQTATPEQVNLKQNDEAGVPGAPGEEEANQDRVTQMAQNAVDI